MADKKLKVNIGFKRLIGPLSKKEYLQLETDILKNGCTEPVVTWNNIIIDGHNRYEICTRHNIHFAVSEMNFDCREAVVVWICANQLKRKNISIELRKFLIGTQYESEKIMNSKTTDMKTEELGGNRIEKRIAEENRISHVTVQKYAVYTKAIEEIGEKEPALVPKILSGQYKISYVNIIELSKLPVEDIKKFNQRIEKEPAHFVQFKKTRKVIRSRKEDRVNDAVKMPIPSVKDMPKYDPDAEISSLALTIPSWKSSIERTRANANLSVVSPEARKRVTDALDSLRITATEMIAAIEEEKWKT